MILSFRDKRTELIFSGRCPKRFPPDVFPAARRKLEAINAAHVLADLQSPPGNRLHALSRDRAGQHAIRINDQFRICFRWTDAGPAGVEIVDHH